jgi:hypothetical protein
MEILVDHGTPEQKSRWLQPLLDGEIRSCFSMTEPQTAGSDPTGLAARAELDGELREGRARSHFERRFALQAELRGLKVAMAPAVRRTMASEVGHLANLKRVLEQS